MNCATENCSTCLRNSDCQPAPVTVCPHCGADLTKPNALHMSTDGWYRYDGQLQVVDGQPVRHFGNVLIDYNEDSLELAEFSHFDWVGCTECGQELTAEIDWNVGAEVAPPPRIWRFYYDATHGARLDHIERDEIDPNPDDDTFADRVWRTCHEEGFTWDDSDYSTGTLCIYLPDRTVPRG